MAEHTHADRSSEATERTDEPTTSIQSRGGGNGITAIVIIVLMLLALVAFMYLSGGDIFANQLDDDIESPNEDAGGSQQQEQEQPEGGSNSEFDPSSVGGFM